MLNHPEDIALFNAGDDAVLVDRFFDDELLFTGGAREYRRASSS